MTRKRFPGLTFARPLGLAVGALLLCASLAGAEEARGRLVLELTPEAARALRAGTLELPRPAGGSDLAPRLVPLFRTVEEPLGRYALLTFDPGRHPGRAGLPRGNRAWLDAVRGSPRVRRAESDRVLPLSALPDDPSFPGQVQLWNPGGLSLEAVRSWPLVPADGEVVVAVLDSGVDWRHPDLGGEGATFPPDGVFWRNEAERNGVGGVDDDGNGFVDDYFGWDFVDSIPVAAYPGEDGTVEDNDPADFQGHGTKVAGLVTSLSNNGECIAGMPPSVKIMALRVGWAANPSLAGLVYMSYCAQALVYAAENGARVANCSWDSDSSLGLDVALDVAINQYDMVIVGSAGNHASSSTSGEYLSSRDDCLGVASLRPDGTLTTGTGGSNYGSWVDIAAFGTGVPTTAYLTFTGESVCSVIGGLGGTSFAAPQISAQAALLRLVDPSATAAQVRDVIKTTGQDLHDVEPVYADSVGGGLADCTAALLALGGGWDDPGPAARLLTPFGTGESVASDLAAFSDTALHVRGGTDGAEVAGWEGGLSAPRPSGPLPVTASWGAGATPRLFWVDGELLRMAEDGLYATSPLVIPGDPTQPLAVPSAAGEEIVFVPSGSDVIRLEAGTMSPVLVTSLGWPATRLAAGDLGGDPGPEVAGIDSAGTLRVWEDGTGALAGWSVELGPVDVGPVLVELETAGEVWVAAGGPDPGDPLARQIVHLVGPGGSPHREIPLEAPPLTALSAAGFHTGTRVYVVAVDEGGGIHLLDAVGVVGELDAGGVVAGEVLCADVNGDWSSDLVAGLRDGRLLAWDADLQPVPGFPRVFPFGLGESPLLLDGPLRRYAVVADTTGAVWSLPLGESDRPAPWPAARGGRRRDAFLGFGTATPVEPAAAVLTWSANGPCWEGSGLETFAALRLREEAGRVLWQGDPVPSACPAVEVREGTTVRLEGGTRTGEWQLLARAVAPGAGFRVGPAVPNPFAAESVIRWSGARERVRIELYDVQGRRLLAVERPEAEGSFRWDGRDGSGRLLPGGLYFLRLREGSRSEVRRLLKVPGSE